MDWTVVSLSGLRAAILTCDWTAIFLTSAPLLCGAIHHLRSRRRLSLVKVNCWFCNQNAVDLRGQEDSWDCPHCQQYNGFDKDGDYNKTIYAQYDENLNVVSGRINIYDGGKPQKWGVSPVTLCKKCNHNETLKISKLAAFTPKEENNFDEEVGNYKDLLERAYPLCYRCQAAVDAYIKHQNYQLRCRMLDYHLQRTERNKCYSQNFGRSYSIRSPLRVIISRFLAFLSCMFLLSLAVLGSRDGKSHPVMQPQQHANTMFVPVGRHSFWTESRDSIPTFKHLSVMWLLGQTHQKEVALFGLLASVFAIFSAGRVRLRRIDVFSSYLWLLVFCLYHLAGAHTWLVTVRLGTTSLCCVFGFMSSMFTRTVRGQRRFPS